MSAAQLLPPFLFAIPDNDQAGRFVLAADFDVDGAGNVFVVDFTLDRISKLDSKGRYLMHWGEEGSGPGQLQAPQAIDVVGDKVFVAELGNRRIQRFDTQGTFETEWSTLGRSPRDVAVGPDGAVYVVVFPEQIQRYDSAGKLVALWGSQGDADGQFRGPQGIAVDGGGNVYVADTANDRIQKFDAYGQFLAKWGTDGTGPGEFRAPYAVAVEAGGTLLVVDPLREVQRFTPTGTFLEALPWAGMRSIAVDGSGLITLLSANQPARLQRIDGAGNALLTFGLDSSAPGELVRPHDVALDESGRLYVADSGNKRIQVFSPDVAFLSQLRAEGMGLVREVAVGPDGSVYAADDWDSLQEAERRSSRIFRFDPAGRLLQVWGSGALGSGDGEFGGMVGGLAVGPHGDVYTVDLDNDRVQVFSPEGTFLRKWGSNGSSQGQFRFCGFGDGGLGLCSGFVSGSLAIAPNGDVLVVDTINDRVQRFDREGDFLDSWSTGLDIATGIAIDQQGHSFVTYTPAPGVHPSPITLLRRFDPSGVLVASGVLPGSEVGALEQPKGLAVAKNGTIYVAELVNNRISVFGNELPPPTPVAPDFGFSPSSPVVGQTVQFADQSSAATSWSWKLGDGAVSSERSPRHFYSAAGAYEVELSAGNRGGSATITKRVSVLEPGALAGVEFTKPVVAVREGDGVATLSVRRTDASSATTSVAVLVEDGTARGDDDYAATPDVTLSWSAGDSSAREVAIVIVNDGQIEPPELLSINLVDPVGLELGALHSASLLILDDDFDVSGGGELPVGKNAQHPTVAHAPDGRKLIAWEQVSAVGRTVRGQFFDPLDRPIGEAFDVADPSTDQSRPAAAWTSTGEAVIVWLAQATIGAQAEGAASILPGGSILGRRFDPGGTPAEGAVPLSPPDAESPRTPDVSADAAGDLVVTWDEENGPRARTFTPKLVPKSDRLILDPNLIEGAGNPVTDKAASGEFVVVWLSPAVRRGIRARVFDRNGTTITAAFFVTTDSQAAQPAVAMNDLGEFVVVWTAPTSEGLDISGQRFDRAGRPLGAPFGVNADTAGDQLRPRVDVNSAGDFVVTWESGSFIVDAGENGSLAIVAASRTGASIVGRFFSGAGEPVGGDVPVASTEDGLDPTDVDVGIDDHDGTTVVFGRRDAQREPRGIEARSLRPTLARAECDDTDVEALCLQRSRFDVRARWHDGSGSDGVGAAVPLTSDTGYFWFFDPENIELVIKILDGCDINGHYWVFAGGLTDVAVSLTVDDVLSGQSKQYFKPAATAFAPVLDTTAFASCGSVPAARERRGPVDDLATVVSMEVEALSRLSPRALSRLSMAECALETQSLCLNQNRFRVEVDWRAPQGGSGRGEAVPLTGDSGYFWFFDSTNVELVVKALNGCSLNEHYWVFAGGLTDVETTLTITDAQTGASRTYRNEPGTPFQPIRDTTAFATCP